MVFINFALVFITQRGLCFDYAEKAYLALFIMIRLCIGSVR